MTATGGAYIQRQIVSQTPIQMLMFPPSGKWTEYLAVPAGNHMLRLRYTAPLTGDYGPWSETPFTAAAAR
jgi:hypothetical protein